MLISRPPVIVTAPSTNAPLTSSGVANGWWLSSTAAAPDTSAVLMDVPLPRKYAVPTRPPGCDLSTVEPDARNEITDTPGAATFGFE
jgi:hypothetical protein